MTILNQEIGRLEYKLSHELSQSEMNRVMPIIRKWAQEYNEFLGRDAQPSPEQVYAEWKDQGFGKAHKVAKALNITTPLVRLKIKQYHESRRTLSRI